MTDAFAVRLDSAPVLARLAEIARRVDDLSPAMRAIGEALAESTKERFSTSTGPDGEAWERLAASTVLGRLQQITGGTTGSYRTRGAKKGAVNKDGSLSKRSRRALENVKPLVDTGILQDTIRYQIINGGRGTRRARCRPGPSSGSPPATRPRCWRSSTGFCGRRSREHPDAPRRVLGDFLALGMPWYGGGRETQI